MVGLKKQSHLDVKKNLIKNDEPQRYGSECRRRRAENYKKHDLNQ